MITKSGSCIDYLLGTLHRRFFFLNVKMLQIYHFDRERISLYTIFKRTLPGTREASVYISRHRL